ncbi:MAG: hypothetical protein Q4B28_02645 [bacterium]|nr:hypothetical protein [bacterium]
MREEQAVALRASQLMMRKVLELGMFSRDQDNQKMGIRRGNLVVSEHSPELEFVGKSHPILSKTFDQEVQSELQKLSIEPILIEGKQEFDKYHKAIAICKLKPQEQDTIAFTKLLQAQIEKTQSEIVWQGKRGDIRYLPEKSALKSWGNAVVFEQKGEQFYLKGLEV